MALLTLVFPPDVFAEDVPTPNADALSAVTRDLDTNAEIAANHALCPADAFKTSRPYWRILLPSSDRDEAMCSADLPLCLDDCLVQRNENACFALARVLQEHEETGVAPKYAHMMFAQACATGSSGGCTNRAAGIRNARPAGDPFDRVEAGARDMCQFRSFETSCSNDDAWGCAMLGQSFQFGEGVAADRLKARGFYEKSCMINPDFPACDYAKAQLDSLR